MEKKKNFNNTLLKFATLVTLLFIVSAFAFAKDIKGTNIPNNLKDFNCLGFNPNAIGKSIKSPCNAKVLGSYKTGKTKTVLFEVNQNYYWESELKTCTYELIITNIKNFTEVETVQYGEEIGLITEDSVLIARSKETDPYLVRLTQVQIIKHKDYYYFQPSWFTNPSTTTLDYRAIPSLEDHANDFYNRWLSECDEEIENRKMVSIFNWSEVDSVRVKIVLNEYPEPIQSSTALGLAQSYYFGRNILAFQTPYICEATYTPYLYWQIGFDEYLKNEYKLGDDIYIYCTFLALDHDNKRIIINVRDFNNRPDEEIYEERISSIIEKK